MTVFFKLAIILGAFVLLSGYALHLAAEHDKVLLCERAGAFYANGSCWSTIGRLDG